MSEYQYEVEELEAEAGIQVEFLPQITPDVQNAALAQVDERHLIAQSALDELESALDGYDDLLVLVQRLREVSVAQKNDAENATILLGAFWEGMRTLKQQRDEKLREYDRFKQMIAIGDQTHPDIKAALSDALEDGIELASESFLNDLTGALAQKLNIDYMDALRLAEALYGFSNQVMYEDEVEEVEWEEIAIPEEGMEHLLKLLEVIKKHRGEE